MPKQFADIYRHVIDAGSPITFQPPWHFLTAHDDCVCSIRNAKEMEASLRERFDTNELQEARVLVPDSTGVLQLNPDLSKSGSSAEFAGRFRGEAA